MMPSLRRWKICGILDFRSDTMNYGDCISWSTVFAVGGPLFFGGLLVGWFSATMLGSAFNHGADKRKDE